MERLTALGIGAGFSRAGLFCAVHLKYQAEVRDMCAANLCGMYGKSWVCPPACGSLEEICERARRYTNGLVVQTTVTLDDPFDYDGMQAGLLRHQRQFECLMEALRREGVPFLPMGAGACTLCETCSYPTAPCRFPQKAVPSMEAYGLMVNDVCQLAGLAYHYGPNTLTYTALALLEEGPKAKEAAHE